MTQWRLVGKIKDAHGLGGEVYVLVFSGESDWQTKLQEFVCSSRQVPTETCTRAPRKVEKIKKFKNGVILKIKDINDRTAAEGLKGQLFFIAADLLTAKSGERIYLSQILNFAVFNGPNKVGLIKSFSSNGPQDLLVVDYKNKLVEIPFVEAFIEDLDFAGQKLVMQLPEGLLDLDEE